MNRAEAMVAMAAGKKVTHAYFETHEWVQLKDGRINLEDGVTQPEADFWAIRQDAHWDKEWEIFNDQKSFLIKITSAQPDKNCDRFPNQSYHRVVHSGNGGLRLFHNPTLGPHKDFTFEVIVTAPPTKTCPACRIDFDLKAPFVESGQTEQHHLTCIRCFERRYIVNRDANNGYKQAVIKEFLLENGLISNLEVIKSLDQQLLDAKNQLMEQVMAWEPVRVIIREHPDVKVGGNIVEETVKLLHKSAEISSWISLKDEQPEDEENVLWHKAPVTEPPYCGSTLDTDFVHDYYTHFQRLTKLPDYMT